MFAGPEAFTKSQRRYREVTVGGLLFRIRSLTERERAQLELSLLDDDLRVDRDQLETERARVIIAHVVNEDGLLVMTEEHIDSIMEADSAVTSELEQACREHSGISKKKSGELDAINAKKNESETTSD